MFKQMSVYRFELPTELDGDEHANNNIVEFASDFLYADSILSERLPRDPEKSQYYTIGLLPIHDDILVASTNGGKLNGFVMLTQVRRERLIKSSAINQAAQRKIEKFEASTGEPSTSEDRSNIKADIIAEMLAKAPIIEKHTQGYITADGWIMVNAVGKAAEEYLSYLREVFGSLECLPYAAFGGPSESDVTIYARDMLWKFVELSEEEEENELFVATGDFKFTHGKEKITVNESDPTTTGEVLGRLNLFQLSFIGLRHENISFRLTNRLELKSIKLIDIAYEPEDDEEAGLTAAYYRFYLTILRNRYLDVVTAISTQGD